MPDHYPLLIPGSPVPSKPMEVDAPWDGRVIATVDTAGTEVVDQALATAHALYRDRAGGVDRRDDPAVPRRVDFHRLARSH